MKKTVTASFVITLEQKGLLEHWAAKEDRSVSYVMRQILKEESQRRKQVQTNQEQPKQQNTPEGS